MRTKKKSTDKQMSRQNPVGRPARPMPDRIPDTPENIARAILAGPPKKDWQYLRGH